MKEELQGKLVEILTSMQKAAGKASDFAMEQLPDIAQSYVAYGRVVASVEVTAWLLATVVGVCCFAYLWRNPWFSTYSWDEGKNKRADTNQMALTLSSVVSVFCAIGLIVATMRGALVWFAPKVWLLKEIAGMLK